MNILIADDEIAVREHLSTMVESLPGCHDIGHASNGIEAVYKAYDLDIDVVLMDIRMPRMNGLEAARHISEFESPLAVVFTTAYAEHALEAFGVHASGFLLKPIQRNKLVQVLEHLQQQLLHKVAEPAVFDNVENSYICCRLNHGLDLIALNRVMYIKTNGKCAKVHHLNGYSISEQSLKSFEQKFGDRLLRIHRNSLVNKAYVHDLSRRKDGVYTIGLRGSEETLEVSRRNLPSVREYLHTFMQPRTTIQRRELFLMQHKQTKNKAG